MLPTSGLKSYSLQVQISFWWISQVCITMKIEATFIQALSLAISPNSIRFRASNGVKSNIDKLDIYFFSFFSYCTHTPSAPAMKQPEFQGRNRFAVSVTSKRLPSFIIETVVGGKIDLKEAWGRQSEERHISSWFKSIFPPFRSGFYMDPRTKTICLLRERAKRANYSLLLCHLSSAGEMGTAGGLLVKHSKWEKTTFRCSLRCLQNCSHKPTWWRESLRNCELQTSRET